MSPRFSDLPVAIQLFFGVHDKDATLLAHVFAPEAIVIEHQRLFKGIASIDAWHRDFEARHREHRFEPLALACRMRTLRARMRLRGAFPGSPLDLRYRIDMRDHRIAAVRIYDAPVKRTMA